MRRFVLLLLLFLVWPLISADAQDVDRTVLRWLRQKKPAIDSIVVDGNAYFSDAQIRDQMYSRKRTFWHAIKGERRSRIQRETLDRDTLEIKYIYLRNGFLGVRVQENFELLVNGRDSTALVRVAIDEGRQLFYGPCRVTGSYDPVFGQRLSRIAQRFKQGRPISLFELRQAVFDMKTVLANQGYPYSQITYTLDTITASVTPITFAVESDSLVHFGKVTVEGLGSYPEYIARRELKIRPGETYRRDDIINSQKRLFESGYFSFLQLNQAQNGGDRLNPDFTLKVRQKSTRYLSVTTGASQSDVRDLLWSLGLGFGKRNFFGSRRLDLLSDYAISVGHDSRLITHRYRLRYTEPWFLGIRMPVQLTGEIEPPLKSALQDFKIATWSISLATSKKFGEEMKLTGGLEYVKVEISGVPESEADSLRQVEGISVRRKLYMAFRRDSRDNIFIPRQGSLTDLSAEYFGGFLGGDDNFYKIEGSWASYQVIWPGWISATRFRAGYTKAFDGSAQVPVEELLYLGGANTVRGFRENSLGPLREDGSAEGANYTLIFNQEFRWRTLQIFQPVPILNRLFSTLPLWQSVFFDMGNGFRSESDITLSGFAYSYGTGIQIVSPAGPIRIDYARRIKTDKYDFDSRWHFTILYAF